MRLKLTTIFASLLMLFSINSNAQEFLGLDINTSRKNLVKRLDRKYGKGGLKYDSEIGYFSIIVDGHRILIYPISDSSLFDIVQYIKIVYDRSIPQTDVFDDICRDIIFLSTKGFELMDDGAAEEDSLIFNLYNKDTNTHIDIIYCLNDYFYHYELINTYCFY